MHCSLFMCEGMFVCFSRYNSALTNWALPHQRKRWLEAPRSKIKVWFAVKKNVYRTTLLYFIEKKFLGEIEMVPVFLQEHNIFAHTTF